MDNNTHEAHIKFEWNCVPEILIAAVATAVAINPTFTSS